MPRKGWKSISVPERVYNYFREGWEQNKEEYEIKYGVTSFSGFVCQLLYAIKNERKDRLIDIRDLERRVEALEREREHEGEDEP